MKAITREWIEKAEADFASARRELRARKAPNYDSACFHSQQCAEKYLKALLQDTDTPFPKTHDLVRLLDLAIPSAPLLDALREELARLTSCAVEFRYPGDAATREIAKEALSDCRLIRSELRRFFDFPPETLT